MGCQRGRLGKKERKRSLLDFSQKDSLQRKKFTRTGGSSKKPKKKARRTQVVKNVVKKEFRPLVKEKQSTTLKQGGEGKETIITDYEGLITSRGVRSGGSSMNFHQGCKRVKPFPGLGALPGDGV